MGIKQILFFVFLIQSGSLYSKEDKIDFDSTAVSIIEIRSTTSERVYNENLELYRKKYIGHKVKVKPDAKGVFYKISKDREIKKLFKPIKVNSNSFFDFRFNDNVALPNGDPKKCYIGNHVDIRMLADEEFEIIDFVQHVFDKSPSSRHNFTGKTNYRVVLRPVNYTSYYFAIFEAGKENKDFRFLISEKILEEAALWKEIQEAEARKQKAVEDSLENVKPEIVNVVFESEQKKKEEARLKMEHEKQKEEDKRLKTEELAKIKKWGKKNYELISNGQVKIGMTKEMCIEAWGFPITVNENITSYGRDEQWVYDGFNYLYFEQNKLTGIQSSN